jgi:hypothetical protein
MDFNFKESHLTFFFILLTIVCTSLGSVGLALVSLTILALVNSLIIPIRDHFLITDKTELETIKQDLDRIKLELNALKIQQGIKTLR